jgi:hypothetical protein
MARNYSSTLRNIPEERRFNLRRWGSSKSQFEYLLKIFILPFFRLCCMGRPHHTSQAPATPRLTTYFINIVHLRTYEDRPVNESFSFLVAAVHKILN